MVKNFTTRVSEQKDASLESPFGASEQKDASLESPFGVSEQKDASSESPFGVSEQKDAPLESPFGVSEQKDASLESPLRASEQKDAPLESPTRVSEQKDAPLESPLRASEQKDTSLESPTAVSLHQRPQKCFPTAAPSGQRPLKWFPTAAPSGHWLSKCFPTAANEWRSPLSAGRVGAQKHTPPMFKTRNGSVWLEGALICNCPYRGIGWGVCNTPLLLGTPLGHPPIKWFPTRANEWRSPLSAGRVGAYCIRPQMFGTRNGGVWLEGALICNCPCRGIGWGVCNTPLLLGTPLGHPPIKWFPTRANEWRSPLSAGRVGAYCIRPQMFGTRNGSVCPRGAYKMVSDGSAFGSLAPKMVSNDSAFGSAAPIIFFRENCNKRRASASQ